jgi:transcriptional regulator with XRE-family HTH domain
MQFDARYQVSNNGPLTKDVRDRLDKFRQIGFTLKDIGDRLGFSGPFISQLLNSKSPGRVRTIHIPKIIQAIEHAEIENGIAPNIAAPKNKTAISEMSLEALMHAIEAKGFEVTVKPKQAIWK